MSRPANSYRGARRNFYRAPNGRRGESILATWRTEGLRTGPGGQAECVSLLITWPRKGAPKK